MGVLEPPPPPQPPQNPSLLASFCLASFCPRTNFGQNHFGPLFDPQVTPAYPTLLPYHKRGVLVRECRGECLLSERSKQGFEGGGGSIGGYCCRNV